MSNFDASLHSPQAQGRKYLNQKERQRFLAAARQLPVQKRLFAETLAWTGPRISEVRALVPASFDLDDGYVTLPTLKQRKPATRDIPLPPDLLARLDAAFGIRRAQRDPDRVDRPLWSFCRVTGWRVIKHLMHEAGVIGRRASPRGLRHAFGVGALQAGVPVMLLKRWLGHARLSTTEIYTHVTGHEEIEFAGKFWKASKTDRLRSSDAAKTERSSASRPQPAPIASIVSRIAEAIAAAFANAALVIKSQFR